MEKYEYIQTSVNLSSKTKLHSTNLTLNTEPSMLNTILDIGIKKIAIKKKTDFLNRYIANSLSSFEATVSEYTQGFISRKSSSSFILRNNSKELKLQKALEIYRTAKETGNEERKCKCQALVEQLEDEIFDTL